MLYATMCCATAIPKAPCGRLFPLSALINDGTSSQKLNDVGLISQPIKILHLQLNIVAYRVNRNIVGDFGRDEKLLMLLRQCSLSFSSDSPNRCALFMEDASQCFGSRLTELWTYVTICL